MQKYIYQLTIFCILAILAIGCSSNSNPVAPIESGYDQITKVNTFPLGVSDYNADGNPMNGYGVLGLFEFNVDIDSLTGEVQSLRSTSSAEVLEIVDITNFLTIAPCGDCVKLMGVELSSSGNVILKIGIKHPFAAGDSLKPVSGQNRADLHVFNVEGQVLIETLSTTFFSGIGDLVDDLHLVNSDGLSPYLDGVLDPIVPTTATVHPYKLHFDDYSAGNYDLMNPMGFQSVTSPPPSGNLVMAMGSDYDVQPYEFDLASGNLDFVLAVGCTYGVSADSKMQRFSPEYRVPQHLKKAASEVSVRIVSNNLFDGNSSSTADLAIDIVDISHGVAVGQSMNEMLADSSVGGISIAIPGVLSAVASVPLTNTGGTGHDAADPLTFEITIQNEQSAAIGTYPGLVKVLDTYIPGQNLSPGLLGNDGIKRVDPAQNPLEGLFTIAEFATYQVFDIDVTGIPNDLPTAILLPDPVDIYVGQAVNFNGTTSTDTDGTITLYEFDYDWDAVEANFSADASNATGTVISDPYLTEGTFTAGLRVTDDLGGLGYDSNQVTVSVYSGSCPNAPFNGYTISAGFTWDEFHYLSWNLADGAHLDADVLSNGDGIMINSDSGGPAGDLMIFDVYGMDGSNTYSTVEAGYPGEQGVSIDVDSTDLVVFVTCGTNYFEAQNDPGECKVSQRIAASNDYFTVVDPSLGSSSEQDVVVGTTIAAVDVDGYDNVWVLDTDNIMHMYTKSTGYTEDTARQFDLDSVTTGAFTGNVYDFEINFYNEAFFILTDGSAQCDLWRIECNGVYNSSVAGNPNPATSILLNDTQFYADITIDNLDASGNHLTGDQDSQIVVAGGNYSSSWDSLLTRVTCELEVATSYRTNESFADGIGCTFMDERSNLLHGFERGQWSAEWTESWIVPSGWQ